MASETDTHSRTSRPREGDGLAGMMRRAKESFESLAGMKVVSVSSVTPDDDGWRVGFEVVELERIPDSTSLLGSYEVVVDADGDVVEFTRLRRYYRNRADEEM